MKPLDIVTVTTAGGLSFKALVCELSINKNPSGAVESGTLSLRVYQSVNATPAHGKLSLKEPGVLDVEIVKNEKLLTP